MRGNLGLAQSLCPPVDRCRKLRSPTAGWCGAHVGPSGLAAGRTMTLDPRGFPGTERFHIERCLGSGGMGVVYEALDRDRNEVVALKTLRWTDPSAIYRLKREFRTLVGIVHPNLVALYELFGEAEDRKSTRLNSSHEWISYAV